MKNEEKIAFKNLKNGIIFVVPLKEAKIYTQGKFAKHYKQAEVEEMKKYSVGKEYWDEFYKENPQAVPNKTVNKGAFDDLIDVESKSKTLKKQSNEPKKEIFK